MVKRRTKKQKLDDYFDAFKCVQGDKKVKRSKAKDGSIQTHPVVPCPDLPECEVLVLCLVWLKDHNIFCNSLNNGTVQTASGWHSYGIRGAGDIMGLLPDTGRHFEVECKRGRGGKLSEAQQKRMVDVKNNNGIYLVVHGVAEMEYLFKGEVI